MTTFSFRAECVAIETPDQQFLLVGFADSEQHPVHYLMLQRALAFDEQDIALGMDSYHVEWCDEAQSGYGGIERCELTAEQVCFRFTPEVVAALNGLQTVVIDLRLTRTNWQRLRQALTQLFADSDCQLLVR